MDVPLEDLAAVSEALGRGEDAAQDAGWTTARQALDDADAALEVLRGRWTDLDERGRATLGRLAVPLRARRDALAAAIPRPQVVSDGAAVHDPEQDEDPVGTEGDPPAAPAPPAPGP